MATDPNSSEEPSLRVLFEDTRKRLVETGTRNRLVHVNRANVRGNVINIVNERSDDVYAILSSGKAMRFRAIGKDKDDEDGGGIRLVDVGNEGFDAGRFTDNLLETKLGPDALEKKLLKIHRESKTAEEEQGVNILYLALGFLRWFEDKSSAIMREAPLVLLPIELTRSARGSSFDVRLRDEDIFTNLPLQQRLRNDFGIRIPNIDDDEDAWCPSDYFEKVSQAVSNHERWSIDGDGMQLGFFSFAKLLMYLDLDPDAWPEKSIENHALTRGLLFERFPEEDPLFAEDTKLDEVLPPAQLCHVVDADASQAKVIEEARVGRNLVVQGPPGTGKSQTITNIIAAAVREGKTVLFVAEKMAALSVVHERLVKHGLRDVCLEIHSKNTSKKAVLAELARTLQSGVAMPNVHDDAIQLTEARDKLNRIAEMLHTPMPGCDETAYSALSRLIRFIGRGTQLPEMQHEGLTKISKSQAKHLSEAITAYGLLAEKSQRNGQNAFAGSTNLNLQPLDLKRLESKFSSTTAQLRRLSDVLSETTEWLGIESDDLGSSVAGVLDQLERCRRMPPLDPKCLESIIGTKDQPKLNSLLTQAQAWVSQRRQLGGAFVELAFNASVDSLRGPLAAGQHSFFARWGSAYRGASRELLGLLRIALPRSAAERVTLIDDLLDERQARGKYETDEPICAAAFGSEWQGVSADFVSLQAGVEWAKKARGNIGAPDGNIVRAGSDPERLEDYHRRLTRALDESNSALDEIVSALGLHELANSPLKIAADRLMDMATEVNRYDDWVELSRARARLTENDLAELADQIDQAGLTAKTAAAEFNFARAEAIWKRALESLPGLATIRQLDRHELASLFAKLEHNRLRENSQTIVAQHLNQLPRGAVGQMGIIRAEIAKRKRHMPLRKLFSTAGTALQRIKPVMLMSPISVAQFLPPGVMQFDLLVIDEASQVRPEDAFGAIARAKQIVVVGDQKQLPPTSFFDRLLGDDGQEDEENEEAEELLGHAAAAGQMESILSLCEARGLGGRMLEWHYRSRDPSLIRVSNREFYGDRLILPPSPLQGDPRFGLCFTRVNGVYARGGKRDNRFEGEAVVTRVSEHARSRPELSLGIVTFSSSQRNLITELLELARRSDSILDDFLREGKAEDVFVKNIENVQGDERDVILISVGYGPSTPGGRLANMTFGPVNAEGGERRLNVLFTRARVRCEVFASFDPADIDTTRTSRDGPKVLKRFLEFAAHGSILDAEQTGEEAETPFEEEVADVIRDFGYFADPQVGSAGFRIDLGVRHPDHPGAYILAIECDGATYHSALWARERDRLRQEVLEHLGWRFHRIWSTDWFYDRSAEIERLRSALATARERSEAGLTVKGVNVERPPTDSEEVRYASTAEVRANPERKMPDYERFSERSQSWLEPHEVDRGTLGALAERIIDFEGPISAEDIARRIASSYGKEKAGSRILKATREALARLKRNNSSIETEDDFWFTAAQTRSPPVRDRSTETGATLKAGNISLLEIQAALRIALDDCGGASDVELVRTAARLLGFRRLGSELQARLSDALPRIR